MNDSTISWSKSKMPVTAISCLIFSSWIVRISAMCTNLEASLSKNVQPSDKFCPPSQPPQPPQLEQSPQTDCTTKANIAWLARPPLIYDEELLQANLSQKTSTKEGILPEAIERAFRICCFRVGQNETRLKFDRKPKKNLTELHEQILRDKADIILPVYSAEDDAYGGIQRFEFVEVLKSPRLAVLVNREDLKSHKSVMLQVLNDLWPTAFLAVILAAMFGIILWALETAWNTTAFPRPFHRGAFDGFWWAFVTMSTVGYGDKVPRSSIGRIFAVVWIMIGVSMCSTLTATLTSTFNQINADKEFELTAKKIGVIDDTQAYYEAIKQGAQVKAFHTFQEMQRALLDTREVEAILEEIHPAVYAVQHSNDSRLVILKQFPSERRYGFVINNERHPYLPRCVRSLVKDKQKDIFLLTSEYLTLSKSKTNDDKAKVEVLFHERTVGFVVGTCLVAIIACGSVFQLSCFLWRWRRERKETPNCPSPGIELEPKDRGAS